MKRQATCSCGQLSLVCEGAPVRVSICHCLSCQRRTGSIFGVQARFRNEQISQISGRATQYERVADSGNRVTFNFCPNCGATLYWHLGAYPGLTVVAVGAFADRQFPPPKFSVFEVERHDWWAPPATLDIERNR